jgi:MFS family permease
MTVAMFGLATLLIGFSTSWEMVMILRFICGFGVGGMMVLNTTLLSETWPEKSRAVFIGILSIGFPVGIFSSGAVNFFVSGWQQGFMMGMLPLGISIIYILVLKESEKWKTSRNLSKENRTKVNMGEHRKDLINGSIIFGSMLIGLWAVFSWVPTWVQSLMTSSDGQRERSLSMMLLGVGGLSGGFFSGWVANALGTRRAMILCFSGCFILSCLLFKGNTTFTTITLVEIGMLSFMFGISQGLLGVYIPLLFPVSIRASATGFCFNIGRFFTAAAVYFVGTLVATFNGYGNSLFAFSFVFLMGLVFLLFSKKITN